MGLSTDGYKAVGGSANDGITGNHRSNILVGGAGNDVIKGGPGNDQLYGDNENGTAVAGDDYYIIGVASGNDIIDETSGGGTDVIRWEGMYDYDSIEQDFTFRRFGNDLLVRLELNGQRNNNGEQVRIRNMGTENSRIEAPALLNTNGFVDRISLQSVWDQASESRQRFGIVAGNDSFGSLVAPV
jgi:Ca2+-binding RTX toxin-like protein